MTRLHANTNPYPNDDTWDLSFSVYAWTQSQQHKRKLKASFNWIAKVILLLNHDHKHN